MNQAEQAELAIAALRERFVVRLASDRAAIDGAWRASDDAGLRHLAHGLAGSAGVFGFPELSRLAGTLDVAMGKVLAPGALAERVEALLAAIDGVLAAR